ncbi:GatB/YqeY domain-containing protein [Limosilactobacillus difficilis]|uniref:GatB/YqeY domain-containing protein n=1 Tax=Limosilactobacillus difficilis TaxID=2991838 RepID=UPI0024BA7376|nr:GatB/YqeY domain-containing protein [Limosilactobacillus difficilis]
MSLLATLQKDMIKAMKDHDKDTLEVVRMLKAAVKNEQIEKGHDLSADEELAVLKREDKQRKDSLADFKKAGRDDLIEKTEKELKVVEKYMPAQMSADEVKAVIAQTIKDVDAQSMKDFGKVMGAAMKKLNGRADGKIVNQTVKAMLQ